MLAKMYNILRARRNDFEMGIGGDGHASQKLEKLMQGAYFLGSQTGTELSTSDASSDISVFPSTIETFGLVTLYDMFSRTVLVVAHYGGSV